MKNFPFILLLLTLVSCDNNRFANYDSPGMILSNGMLLLSTQTSKLIIDPEFGLAFDCVVLGCKQSRSIRIANGSGNPITIHKIELAKDSSTDFSLTENPAMLAAEKPFTLTPREHMIINVLYQPSDGAADNASLLIDWQDQHKVVPIHTRVLGEKLAKASASSLNFGYVAVNQQKTLYFFIENTSTGNAVVTISNEEKSKTDNIFTAAFENKLHLNPGQKANIPIVFSPKEDGVFEQEIAFIIEGSSKPRLVARCLGTSVPKAKISVIDPKDGLIDFGTQSYGAVHKKTVTIRNEGNAATTLNVHVLSQPENAFLIEENYLQKELFLAPMETVVLSLVASPKIGGKNTGQLKIKSISGEATSISLPLIIFSTTPMARLSQTEVTLSSVATGWEGKTHYIQIDNNGIGILVIDAINLSADSSKLLTLSNIPTLPRFLAPGDPPIKVGLKLSGHLAGDVFGQLQIHSNATDLPLATVNIKGIVRACDEQCSLPHGQASCLQGKCEIAQCQNGWHDADTKSDNGCECREDFSTNDIGDTCSTGMKMGLLGDACSSLENSKQYQGTIHDKNDVDLFFVKLKDGGSLFCDIFRDSFEASVSLTKAPPGLVLCANIQSFGTGCGGYRREFDPNFCGQTSHIKAGHYRADNSSDITTWVMWHPDAQPVCGEYTILFKAKK